MESEKATYAHCQKCGRWFKIGIRFVSAEAFENAKIKRTTKVCPYCMRSTSVSKQSIRFDEIRIDGRITHTEGKYFL